MEISSFLWAGRKKFKRFFLPLGLLRGTEEVVQNWNGKTSRADWRSVSVCGGL